MSVFGQNSRLLDRSAIKPMLFPSILLSSVVYLFLAHLWPAPSNYFGSVSATTDSILAALAGLFSATSQLEVESVILFSGLAGED